MNDNPTFVLHEVWLKQPHPFLINGCRRVLKKAPQRLDSAETDDLVAASLQPGFAVMYQAHTVEHAGRFDDVAVSRVERAHVFLLRFNEQH